MSHQPLDQTCGPMLDEQRDDLPIINASSSMASDCSSSGNGPQASAVEPSQSCIPATVPFAKTFALSESYRRKLPEMSPATISLTSPFYTPPRRRARSSEGAMLRHYRQEDHQYKMEDTTKSASELTLDASFLSPQNFFSPLNNSNNSNNNNSKQSQLRQRKNKEIKASSLSDVVDRGGNNNSSMQYKNNRRHHRSYKHSPKHGPIRTKSKYVIPLEHPFKVVWDVLTVILSIAHGYLTHVAIRDRQFGVSPFIAFCDAWFLVDILLNFTTERKTNTGEVLSDHRSIIARYLTSWFAVDALSLFPWEMLYMQPLIEVQNRRGILKKSFFRSKAVVRVTRHLRGRHFRWFGTVTKHTKHHGVGAQRLLRLIIKYIPKYWMFIRNMKGVVAIRFFRFVHWSRRFIINVRCIGRIDSSADGVPKSSNSNASTRSVTTHDDDDEGMMLSDHDDDADSFRNKSVEVVYEDFQMMMEDYDDDDDDGVPL
jgi:hypothetical protein